MKQFILIILTCTLAMMGCQKQNEWLDAKRQQSDIVPESLDDFQAILDNSSMNTTFPAMGQLGADNYYFPDDNLGVISNTERNSYIWAKDIFEDAPSVEYTACYQIVGPANIVLEGLASIKIDASNLEYHNSIKGQALFFRSNMFLELASVFCKPFDASTAATDLGICVRTKSNINEITPRSSVQHAYDQIINDLKLAATLLPAFQSHKTRPSKPAAFALLARSYLLTGDFVNARQYADSTLRYMNGLLDFNSNTISISKPYRFPDFLSGNDEIIFYAYAVGNSAATPNDGLNHAFVDSTLYDSYDSNDLRKIYFYNVTSSGKPKFRGTYAGIGRNFAGIATNEVYLIRAECNARLNNLPEAISDLNVLLEKRFRTDTYSPFYTTNVDTALVRILKERRKELPFTGQIRWQDLRRLNKDIRFAKTLTRKVNGVLYQLSPNDKKYVYPFPKNEIEYTGIQQNER
ncbi:RagB/SusD family nutrient uptake outer membrane protein [Chitinophaga cymbidii]|uniref:Glycan metabolism protein RagB n=1 Tax=Chitinophaga cymbidii TaxID=1096750 RepID=A0A512REG8_9BACT|nr:RagB/SusD family nutrient uptake outer membrane protein [Chitinophaga cymbidii]GEP94089.1 glycan metabolism protein RagB [Chitinophaga cymbidii]